LHVREIQLEKDYRKHLIELHWVERDLEDVKSSTDNPEEKHSDLEDVSSGDTSEKKENSSEELNYDIDDITDVELERKYW
jgi:hypothetical protein